MSLSQWVWAPSPKSHLNPQLMGETWSGEFAPQQMPGTHTHTHTNMQYWFQWLGGYKTTHMISTIQEISVMIILIKNGCPMHQELILDTHKLLYAGGFLLYV